jgi:hypothetical protein
MISTSWIPAATVFLLRQSLIQAKTIRGPPSGKRAAEVADGPHGTVTSTVCPAADPAGSASCSVTAKLDPVVCTRAPSGAAEPLHECTYRHLCDAEFAGYRQEECARASADTVGTSRHLDGGEDGEPQDVVDEIGRANEILLGLDLTNERKVRRVFRRYNVSDEDAPYVLELAQALQDEQRSGSGAGGGDGGGDTVVSAMDAGGSSEAVFMNQQLVMFPMPTPAMGGAWQIGDIVAGVGGGIGIEVGARWGRLNMRSDYYRTSQVIQYQMNSFSFIVGYTNINLFNGGEWVGTYHSGGVGVGSFFATGAAFLCQQGQDPLDCIVSA